MAKKTAPDFAFVSNSCDSREFYTRMEYLTARKFGFIRINARVRVRILVTYFFSFLFFFNEYREVDSQETRFDHLKIAILIAT